VIKNFELKHQGTIAEATVVLQLNQGIPHKWAVYHLWVSFFVTFLDKQKSKRKKKYIKV
jgi:hypothetical protein